MKRTLSLIALIGTFSFSSAQLTSINENFDSFTVSTPAFPQNGWTMNAPNSMMVVINEEGTNKFVQGYAFFQVNTPHYLISPQLVAPDGTTSLSFEASKFVQSDFMGTIEAGLVSSPTDMSTFTSLGSAITLQTTTPQTFTYNVPASSSQYIAFKFVGLNNHASTKLDNIVYGNSSLSVNNVKNKSKLAFGINDNILTFIGKTIVKEIRVYNSAGRILPISKIKDNSYDISNLPVGAYLFEVINNDGSSLKSKFLKK